MLDVGHIISALERASTASNQVMATSSNAVPETSVATPARAETAYVTSRIRIDNLQGVVILEYRSETGEVKNQFPTQKQIDAFKRTQQRLVASEKVILIPNTISTEESTPVAIQQRKRHQHQHHHHQNQLLMNLYSYLYIKFWCCLTYIKYRRYFFAL